MYKRMQTKTLEIAFDIQCKTALTMGNVQKVTKGVSVNNYVLFLPFHCHRMSGETIRTFQDLKHRHNLKERPQDFINILTEGVGKKKQ